jgi:hypothetical protein
VSSVGARTGPTPSPTQRPPRCTRDFNLDTVTLHPSDHTPPGTERDRSNAHSMKASSSRSRPHSHQMIAGATTCRSVRAALPWAALFGRCVLGIDRPGDGNRRGKRCQDAHRPASTSIRSQHTRLDTGRWRCGNGSWNQRRVDPGRRRRDLEGLEQPNQHAVHLLEMHCRLRAHDALIVSSNQSMIVGMTSGGGGGLTSRRPWPAPGKTT